jgi:16S rRNA (cytosine967-C5)-methyltransferase
VDLLQGSQISKLKELDQRLVTEIVMGTLRRRGELDHWLVTLAGKPLKYFDPEVATILRLSLYQILFLQKVPKSAVVNEAVELTKAARKSSAAGLVNAVLRKCERSRHTIQSGERAGKSAELDAEWQASAIQSLPPWLAERWERNYGLEAMKSLAATSVYVPPTTLRIAGSEDDREDIQQQLLQEGVATRFGRYSPQALVVESVKSGTVQSSRTCREGRAVIQDEASQLVALLLAPRTGHRVLDLCAAPGIKAVGFAATMAAGLLIASDLSARRLRTMERLLPKALPPNLHLHLVRLDAAKKLPFGIAFDRILVDAPCSGTGTLARNPEIKLRLDPRDLARLAKLQTRILQNAVQALKSGGRLVYATCSLEPEENEQVVENVLQSEHGLRIVPASDLEFPALSALFDSQGFFHTRPDLHGIDGFFAAVIQRDH